MNTSRGKEVLALIRDGHYAHPGEADAIELVFEDFSPSVSRRLLDIGCGLGGTADYVRKLGLGSVVGIDIDAETIEEASRRFPECEFQRCGVEGLSGVIRERFDVAYMFNAFYTFADKAKALCETLRAVKSGGMLIIFDYSSISNSPLAREFIESYQGSFFQPVELDKIEDLLDQCGWKLTSSRDISAEYASWYRAFMARVHTRKAQIVASAGPEWFSHVLDKFGRLLSAIEHGAIGGAIIKAVPSA